MAKPMVFETDLLMEKTEGGRCLKVDLKGVQLIIPTENVRRLLSDEIVSTSISISTGEISRDQEAFVSSKVKYPSED